MSQSNHFLEKKKSLLFDLFNLYENHSYSLDSAFEIFQEAENIQKEITQLDMELSDVEKEHFTETYREVWEAIIQKHREMMALINVENTLLKNQMTQISKKNQVIHSYMDKNQSMFIDRQA